MSHELRLLGPDDAEALRALRLESLRADPDAFLATVEEDAARDVTWFRDRLVRPDDGIVGAWVEGELVGMVGFARQERRRARHKGLLWGVWVAPAARGRGLGRALVAAALDRLRALGMEQCVLSVTTTQHAARALYASLGFQPFGLERRAIKDGDRYLDEEHLVCDLS